MCQSYATERHPSFLLSQNVYIPNLFQNVPRPVLFPTAFLPLFLYLLQQRCFATQSRCEREGGERPGSSVVSVIQEHRILLDSFKSPQRLKKKKRIRGSTIAATKAWCKKRISSRLMKKRTKEINKALTPCAYNTPQKVWTMTSFTISAFTLLLIMLRCTTVKVFYLPQ